MNSRAKSQRVKTGTAETQVNLKRSLAPMRLESLHGLPDRAVALFYAIERLGGHPSFDELMRVTGKSQASIYRALAELFDAGIRAELSRRLRPKQTIRRYCQRRSQTEKGDK